MGPSEDHDGPQTEVRDHATDPLAIAGPFDDGDNDDGNAILESQLAAMGTALTKALTSSLAQMQAVQDQRDAALQERLTLLTAALARDHNPASIVLEQLQESRGGVPAGAAVDAPSTPEHPPQHGADAGAFEGMMDYLAPRAAGEPPPRVQSLVEEGGVAAANGGDDEASNSSPTCGNVLPVAASNWRRGGGRHCTTPGRTRRSRGVARRPPVGLGAELQSSLGLEVARRPPPARRPTRKLPSIISITCRYA